MKIFIQKGAREKLKKAFQCNEGTISHALNFEKNSVLQRKIRSFALNRLNAVCL